jgi:hypothetical protein
MPQDVQARRRLHNLVLVLTGLQHLLDDPSCLQFTLDKLQPMLLQMEATQEPGGPLASGCGATSLCRAICGSAEGAAAAAGSARGAAAAGGRRGRRLRRASGGGGGGGA